MQAASTEIQVKIIKLVEQIVQDWEVDLDESINSDILLVKDLGFASMDFIQLVVSVEEEFQQKLGFHDLLIQEGEYVTDLSVGQLVSFVEEKLNSNTVVSKPESSTKAPLDLPTTKITREQAMQFQQLINSRLAQLQTSLALETLAKASRATKNSPAVFTLSPPRSGSTLLRVILAGHPQLFAPPELHLLTYETLAQRKAALGDPSYSHLLQGTVRALMQLKDCSAEEAQSLMHAYEAQDLTVQAFYGELQKLLGNRILVDKTPTYASHVDILRRAERDFEGALYIHLVRHPYGTIRSYEEAKLERIVPIMHEVSFSRRELAELTWFISHETILTFLQEVPANRQFQLKFEDLVKFPEDTVSNLCQFLGVEFNPNMLDPYQEKAQRMTDGVNAVSEMSGDLKFHLHERIEPSAAERWKQYHTVNFLGDLSSQLATSLGYELTA